MIRALVAALALAAALPAAAQPSPRWGTFEMSFAGYRPNIDAEFGGGVAPYQAAFGGKHNAMLRADLAYSLLVDYGSLDLGFGVGYWEKYGHGFDPPSLGGGPSSDSTALKIVPTRLSLTYRFDVLANQFRWLPLAPYARFSLDRYNWWVNKGSGDTANASGKSGYGATNGYSLSGGVAFLLDAIDPTLAREMDRDTGINHTYLFCELHYANINGFGSKTIMNLSDTTLNAGIAFEF